MRRRLQDGFAITVERVSLSGDHDGMNLNTVGRHHDGRSLYTGEAVLQRASFPAGPHPGELMKKWIHITRDDGTMQWAYDGKPLYTFVKDKKSTSTSA